MEPAFRYASTLHTENCRNAPCLANYAPAATVPSPRTDILGAPRATARQCQECESWQRNQPCPDCKTRARDREFPESDATCTNAGCPVLCLTDQGIVQRANAAAHDYFQCQVLRGSRWSDLVCDLVCDAFANTAGATAVASRACNSTDDLESLASTESEESRGGGDPCSDRRDTDDALECDRIEGDEWEIEGDAVGTVGDCSLFEQDAADTSSGTSTSSGSSSGSSGSSGGSSTRSGGSSTSSGGSSTRSGGSSTRSGGSSTSSSTSSGSSGSSTRSGGSDTSSRSAASQWSAASCGTTSWSSASTMSWPSVLPHEQSARHETPVSKLANQILQVKQSKHGSGCSARYVVAASSTKPYGFCMMLIDVTKDLQTLRDTCNRNAAMLRASIHAEPQAVHQEQGLPTTSSCGKPNASSDANGMGRVNELAPIELRTTDSHTDEQTHAHTDEQTHAHTDEQTHARADERTHARADKRADVCTFARADKRADVCTPQAHSCLAEILQTTARQQSGVAACSAGVFADDAGTTYVVRIPLRAASSQTGSVDSVFRSSVAHSRSVLGVPALPRPLLSTPRAFSAPCESLCHYKMSRPHPSIDVLFAAHEDSKSRRGIVRGMRSCGIRWVCVENGRKALEWLKHATNDGNDGKSCAGQRDGSGSCNKPCRVLLLDHFMPDMGGPKTAERARKLYHDLCIVGLTPLSPSISSYRPSSTDTVIHNPASAEDVLHTLCKLLDEVPLLNHSPTS